MSAAPEIPAYRYDAGSVGRCRMPAPSALLFEEMARAMAFADVEQRGQTVGCTGCDDCDTAEKFWALVDDATRELYVAVAKAKAGYGVMARFAGARPEAVPDPRSSL